MTVQTLEEKGRCRRVQFYRFYINMMDQDRTCYQNIIWSDECTSSPIPYSLETIKLVLNCGLVSMFGVVFTVNKSLVCTSLMATSIETPIINCCGFVNGCLEDLLLAQIRNIYFQVSTRWGSSTQRINQCELAERYIRWKMDWDEWFNSMVTSFARYYFLWMRWNSQRP